MEMFTIKITPYLLGEHPVKLDQNSLDRIKDALCERFAKASVKTEKPAGYRSVFIKIESADESNLIDIFATKNYTQSLFEEANCQHEILSCNIRRRTQKLEVIVL